MKAFASIKNQLRSTPWIYRASLFLRHCLFPSFQDAIGAFYRGVVSRAALQLYSTPWLRSGSVTFRWLSRIPNGPPFKQFSIYQALRCGCPDIQGRIVLHDQGTPIVRKGSLMDVGTIKQHIDQPWPIFWSRHEHHHLATCSLALITPEKELCLESAYGDRYFRDDPAMRYWKLPPPIRLSGNWTSIVSRWVPNHPQVPNHSHWLLEALPRLALLKEFAPDTKVLIPPKLARYQTESLAMLGLTPDRLRPSPETHLQVESYYFSSPPSMIACYSPYAVKFLRDSFLSKADKTYCGPRKFFITRKNSSRNVTNNSELEHFFEDVGWGVLDLGELTFAQEIQLFKNAEAICSVLGSGLTNTVFCQPECAVVAFGHDYWTDGTLDWILQVVGIENYHVEICKTDKCRRFHVPLDLLKKLLEKGGAH